MRWFIKSFALFLISVIILSGCANSTPKEEKTKIYSTVSDIDKIVSEMQSFKTEKTLAPYEDYACCYAESYKMNLNLDTKQKKLSGEVSISFNNNTEDILKELCIRLYTASTQKNYETNIIRKATMNSGKTILNIKSDKDPSVIYIDLSQNEIKPQEKNEITLNYEIDIPKSDSRFGYHADKDKQIFNLSFCYPLLAMYKDGSWNTSPYIESGAECNFNKVADFDINFETDENYTVVATGDEETVENKTKIVGKNLREMAIFASNYLKSTTVNTESGITINNYYLDYKCSEYYDYALRSACDSVEIFQKLLGEYPFGELDIVHTFYSSAMEFPGLIMIGFPDINYDKIDTELKGSHYPSLCSRVAHEVAHQWFYAIIGNDPYNKPFLDEGFAEYCEDVLYVRSNCDSIKEAIVDAKKEAPYDFTQTQKEFDEFMQSYIKQIAKDKYIINFPYNKYKKDEYSLHVYEGGKMFLYELRQSMGDAAFFYALKEYCNKYRFKETTDIDLIDVIKTYDNSNATKKILDKYIEIK